MVIVQMRHEQRIHTRRLGLVVVDCLAQILSIVGSAIVDVMVLVNVVVSCYPRVNAAGMKTPLAYRVLNSRNSHHQPLHLRYGTLNRCRR